MATNFHLLDFAVNSAHSLYKQNCRKDGVSPKDLLAFCLELVHLLPDKTYCHSTEEYSLGKCRLVWVTDFGLKRGRYTYCLQAHQPQDRHLTTFACSSCCVQVCKTNCFLMSNIEIMFDSVC